MFEENQLRPADTVEGGKTVKTSLWVAITLAANLLGFLIGYSISTATGVEPGYFETAEAGGYGAGAESTATEGISAEEQEYYKGLTED